MKREAFIQLVRELTALPTEVEWAEFKHNNADPTIIGENISGLSNAAALHGKSAAYIVWGVRDGDHAIVGTTFSPCTETVKGQELENWLVTQLEPRSDVKINEGVVAGKHIVVFEIQPASHMPVRFRGIEYLRIGSYTKKLADHPEKERSLWKLFSQTPFEDGIAAARIRSDEVLKLIDYPEYFNLTKQPLPENRAAILRKLGADKLIHYRSTDRYDITNLGAILFARTLRPFDRLARKALRVVIYRGVNRVETIREQGSDRGYAVGFQRVISFINDQLPQNEQMGQALRRSVRMYPEIAVRELVANALIHQDFAATGAGPMVEIFVDRMDISNPGIPLIDTLRFIDEPPRSRNEALAALMRRMNMCEERGSGIDKVISAIEEYQLPPPDFRVTESSTVAVLLGPRNFSQMDRDERVRACYQHACLLYVSGKRMTNATLRERLGIKDSSYPMASRIIRDAVDAEFIRAHLIGNAQRRDTSYVPFWA